jgi:hypothetical protein
MQRQMDRRKWEALLQPVDRPRAALAGAIVDDPEDPVRLRTGAHRHHLHHQSIERQDPRTRVTAPKELGAMAVPRPDIEARWREAKSRPSIANRPFLFQTSPEIGPGTILGRVSHPPLSTSPWRSSRAHRPPIVHEPT